MERWMGRGWRLGGGGGLEEGLDWVGLGKGPVLFLTDIDWDKGRDRRSEQDTSQERHQSGLVPLNVHGGESCPRRELKEKGCCCVERANCRRGATMRIRQRQKKRVLPG